MDIGVRSMEVRMRIQQKSSSNKRAFASDWEEDAKRIKVNLALFIKLEGIYILISFLKDGTRLSAFGLVS